MTKKIKIALSYGHGNDTYEDKRSKFVVKNGKVYEEHDHNYKVGLVVKRHLVRHGVEVLEVQPANAPDVNLNTRTKKANADKDVKLYWSIHANAGTPTARGWAAFYWSTNKEGKKLAELYAKEMKALGLPLYHNGVYPSVKGTWNDFHELRETKMVAVLTENGFMSNDEDFKYIFENKDNYYEKMGEAHAKVICAYFNIVYKKETTSPSSATPKVENKSVSVGQTGKVKMAKVIHKGSDGVNIRKSPSMTSQVSAVAKYGEAFTIVDESNKDFYKLKSGLYITKNTKYIQVITK